MTVKKIKEIINDMIDEKVEKAYELGLNKEWNPEIGEEIKKTVAEGRILIKLIDKISKEETEELCTNLGL